MDHNYVFSEGNICKDETISAVITEHPLFREHFQLLLEHDLNINFLFEFMTKHPDAHTQKDTLCGAHLQYNGGCVL